MTFKPLLPSHFYKQFRKLTKKDAALDLNSAIFNNQLRANNSQF